MQDAKSEAPDIYYTHKSICVTDFFFGRGTLQDMYREWPTSRFAAV